MKKVVLIFAALTVAVWIAPAWAEDSGDPGTGDPPVVQPPTPPADPPPVDPPVRKGWGKDKGWFPSLTDENQAKYDAYVAARDAYLNAQRDLVKEMRTADAEKKAELLAARKAAFDAYKSSIETLRQEAKTAVQTMRNQHANQERQRLLEQAKEQVKEQIRDRARGGE